MILALSIVFLASSTKPPNVEIEQYEHAQNFDYKKLARSRAREINIASMAPSSRGRGHRVFIPVTGVQFPVALPPRTFISFPFFFWSAR